VLVGRSGTQIYSVPSDWVPFAYLTFEVREGRGVSVTLSGCVRCVRRRRASCTCAWVSSVSEGSAARRRKKDYPLRLTFEVREGYRGTKRQGVSNEGVSAEKEKDLPLRLAFEARKGIALRLTMLYTWVLRRTCECRTRVCERCQGCTWRYRGRKCRCLKLCTGVEGVHKGIEGAR
jgi:hypothetical protein